MVRLNLREGQADEECEGILFFFLCTSGENERLLYTSQRDVGPGAGLVSSAQRGSFLSGLPRGGAPAAASDTGQEERPRGGPRGCWDGKMLGGSRKQTCAEFMKIFR